jgi:hypothetical protein
MPKAKTSTAVCCGLEDFFRADEINHKPGCIFYPTGYERKSLAVNSIKVLTSQLNEALKNAASEGVKVEIALRPVADFKEPETTSYMLISVQCSALID